MPIKFRCPCGHDYTAQESVAGYPFPCNACGRTLRVPKSPPGESEGGGPAEVISGPPTHGRRNLALVGGGIVLLLVALVLYAVLNRAEPELPRMPPATEPTEAALPAATDAIAETPAEPTETGIPTVMRGEEGVKFRKKGPTGTVELIVDPFPEDGNPRKKRRGQGEKPPE